MSHLITHQQVGDGNADPVVRFHEPSEVIAFLDAFTKRGYNQLDTARIYSPHAPGTSEPKIGDVPEKNFIVDTKVNSFHDGAHSKENILKDINDSLSALRIAQINIEYLHQPDRATELKEACEAMDQAHKEGKIKYWGISKHTAQEVETIVKICEKNQFIKPSVYQGEYNPIVRSAEKELFPILRRHNIAFYAYSPAGAGFFAGNHKNVRPGGRFDQSVRIQTAIFAHTDVCTRFSSEAYTLNAISSPPSRRPRRKRWLQLQATELAAMLRLLGGQRTMDL